MDLRIEKTEKAIKNAFIELRSQKPLEKITVRELCTLACINKSTFYAHYADIYALSAALESETVASVLKDVAYAQPYSAENPEAFTKALCLSFLSHSSLIQILFSGKEQGCLASKLEAENNLPDISCLSKRRRKKDSAFVLYPGCFPCLPK